MQVTQRFEVDLGTTKVVLLSAALSAIVTLGGVYLHLCSKRRVYLLDFASYKPPKSLQTSKDLCRWGFHCYGKHMTEETRDFLARISEHNGLSNHTHLPPAFRGETPSFSHETMLLDAKLALFGAVSELLERTGIKARDINCIVVNNTTFSPLPSLCSLIINQYSMRSSVTAYNLGGMGCSAGVIAVDLAKQVLQRKPNSYALVVSTEVITPGWYQGNVRSMAVTNTLFRMGASASILTNKRNELHRCKYELQHVVRVHNAADDTAYTCVMQRSDSAGIVGTELTKNIVGVASLGLERNLSILGPLVLSWSEQLKYAADVVLRKYNLRQGHAYTPKFRKAFQHFCIHAGGKAVIAGLGGNLGLTKKQLEPSFSTLYWYGNTSSASYWYAFGFAEAHHGIRKGDKVWQIGFGSGFKTNSAVWKALRTFDDPRHKAWEGIGPLQSEQMWRDLESAGIRFVDGIMPPQKAPSEKKKSSSPSGEA